jgi:hypothetical protein
MKLCIGKSVNRVREYVKFGLCLNGGNFYEDRFTAYPPHWTHRFVSVGVWFWHWYFLVGVHLYHEKYFEEVYDWIDFGNSREVPQAKGK